MGLLKKAGFSLNLNKNKRVLRIYHRYLAWKYKPSALAEVHFDKIKNFGYTGDNVIEFMTTYNYKYSIISETQYEKHYFFYQ